MNKNFDVFLAKQFHKRVNNRFGLLAKFYESYKDYKAGLQMKNSWRDVLRAKWTDEIL